jgi:hypothetical protein
MVPENPIENDADADEATATCSECGAEVPGREALERHLQIVHSRGEAPMSPTLELPPIPSEWRANRAATSSNPSHRMAELEAVGPALDRPGRRASDPFASTSGDWERARGGSYAFWTRPQDPDGPGPEVATARSSRGRGSHARLTPHESD